MGGVGALLGRWRSDRGLLALLAVVVALTAVLVGAVPRLLAELQRSSLEVALAGTTVDRAGLSAATVVSLRSRDPEATIGEVLAELGAAVEEDVTSPLRDVLGHRSAVLDSVRHDLVPMPGEPDDPLARKLTWRSVQGTDAGTTVVAGTMPDGRARSVEVAGFPEPLALHRFAATRETAHALAMEVGDRRLAWPDPTGPVAARLVVPPSRPVVAELSAIVELSPATDPVWFGDARQHVPARFDSNITTTYFAFGLVPAGAPTAVPGAAAGEAVALTWRYQLDVDALLASDVVAVEQQVRAIRAAVPVLLEEPRWTSGLDQLLAIDAARRATAIEAMSLSAVALVGVVLALLAAGGRLLALRRRDALTLARGRGASRAQLFVADLTEVGLLVGVAALVAGVALTTTVPGRGGAVPVALVAGAAVAVLVGGALPDLRRSLGSLLAERRQRGAGRRGRRLAVDAVAVALGVLAFTRLRSLGLRVDGDPEPLLVAAPVAIALAVAVVAARVAPVPIRAMHLATRSRRTLAVPLGVARAVRGGGAGTLVVLVVLGVAVVTTSAALHRSVTAGQARAAAEQVGADVRIDAPPLASLPADPPPLAPGDTAVDVSVVRASLVTGLGTAPVDVVLADADGMAALDVVAAATIPPVGVAGGEASMGWDGTGAVPLLVSEVLRSAGSPDVGDRVAVSVGDARVAGRIVGVVPRILGRDAGEQGPFVVFDRAAWVAATGEDPGVTSRLLLTDEPTEVVAAVREADDGRVATARSEVLDALREEPAARGVRLTFLVAALAAAAATVAGVLLVLAGSAPTRRAEAAMLSAVGTPRRDVTGAMLAELLPVVLVAALVGVGLTAGVVGALDGRLDLAPFTGTVDVTAVVAPTWWVAPVVVVAATLVVALGAVLTLGRVDPGRTLREVGT